MADDLGSLRLLTSQLSPAAPTSSGASEPEQLQGPRILQTGSNFAAEAKASPFLVAVRRPFLHPVATNGTGGSQSARVCRARRARRSHKPAPAFARAMALGRRRLAGLDVRWPVHASLYTRSRP